MSIPSKAELLEDFMANNDITDDVLLEVLLTHMETDYEESKDASAYENLEDTIRDEWYRVVGQ
jgi:hypothetical protein